MAESTIEWTDFTFNPWIGCAKVSPGCLHCYAERMAKHRSNWGAIWGTKGSRVRTSPATWKNPVAWNREALATGKKFRVFCASLSDVFEDRSDLLVPRSDLFELIKKTPALHWLLLTKRPQNIKKLLPRDWNEGWENVWLGTSTEDQARYDERIEELLAVPARVHFLSAEPLVGPLKMRHGSKDGLDWVIVGGESGPKFREMDLQWARTIRDDAKRFDVKFFFKQHSAYHPKTMGKELDGRIHHNWPLEEKSKKGRPKKSPFSRKEQLRLAQKRFRETHVVVPVLKQFKPA